jgi:hypothetical protein
MVAASEPQRNGRIVVVSSIVLFSYLLFHCVQNTKSNVNPNKKTCC